jgi:hypothetical protein
VRATAGTAEKFTDLVGEPARDAEADEILVVRGDGRAAAVWIDLELDARIGDDHLGHRDGERDDHVVQRQRLGIVGNVETGRLFVAHRAAQNDRVLVFSVGLDHVAAVVDLFQARVGRRGENLVHLMSFTISLIL